MLCVLWPPILILPRDEPSPRCRSLHIQSWSSNAKVAPSWERLSKCHIRLSSHNSCWNLSFSHSFVVNGLGGKLVWKGFGELVAASHPGATQHCLPSLFPQPLAGLPPQVLLHCFLGKFFTQISCWNICVFFIFPFPQTCSCSSCSHVPGNILHPSSQKLFPSVRQWLCLSLSLTQGIPHLPHLPSPWLLSLLCLSPMFWGPCAHL